MLLTEVAHSSSVLTLYKFCGVLFGLFAHVCRRWKTSGWRLLPLPAVLHLTAPWGVSMAAPLFSWVCMCVCALLQPPPCAVLALSASTAELNQHASLFCFVFHYLFFLFLRSSIPQSKKKKHGLVTSRHFSALGTRRRASDGIEGEKPHQSPRIEPVPLPPTLLFSLSVSP